MALPNVNLIDNPTGLHQSKVTAETQDCKSLIWCTVIYRLLTLGPVSRKRSRTDGVHSADITQASLSSALRRRF